MKSKLAAYQGYNSYDRNGANTGNSRNGQYFRKYKTRYGVLNLDVPRDRNGEFSTKTIPKYKRQSDDLENAVVKMY